jgi:hypothetical protein
MSVHKTLEFIYRVQDSVDKRMVENNQKQKEYNISSL